MAPDSRPAPGTAPPATSAVRASHATLDHIHSELDTLARLDHDQVPTPEIAGLLQRVQVDRNRLNAISLALTATFDRRDGARAVDARDTRSFLQDQLRGTSGDAKAAVTTARALGGCPTPATRSPPVRSRSTTPPASPNTPPGWTPPTPNSACSRRPRPATPSRARRR